MAQLEHRTITIKGKVIHYWIKNPQHKKTILFVHGFRGNHKGLVELSEHFNGYRIVIPDLPGHGQSAPLRRRHSFQNYAAFLEAFRTALSLTQFILAGHSYGASICLVYAARFRMAPHTLVLISPVVGKPKWLGRVGEGYYKLAGILPRPIRHRLLKSRLIDLATAELLIKHASKKRRHELIASGRRNLKELNDRVVLESFGSFHGTNFYARAKKIACPALVIAGAKDTIAPPKTAIKLCSRLREPELMIIPHTGHLSPLEEPGTVARLIYEFLD